MWHTRTMEPTKHIESTPDVLGGKPRISGTRIRVWDVYVYHELQGKSPGEIIAAFPQLSLADVYAALAYYWDNRGAIDEQMKGEDDFVEMVRAPGPLEKKLQGTDADSDSVPS